MTRAVQGRLGRPTPPPRQDPAYGPGSLPLGFQTRIDPADVIVHVRKLGAPQPKERPRVAQARTDELGQVTSKAHAYTPKSTVLATQEWQWVMRAARTVYEPVPHPVGVLAFFEVGDGRADGDNLVKLVLDAGNGVLWADDQQVHEMHVHVARHSSTPASNLLVWVTGRRRPGG
ncbi:MAG: RusA family crossover junction endodeoxyribonuclease [Acidimicrobiales bacterium]